MCHLFDSISARVVIMIVHLADCGVNSTLLRLVPSFFFYFQEAKLYSQV